MNLIVFSKHFQSLDIPALISTLKSVGASGADLCVRPGYPVEPETAAETLPAAARDFKAAGLSIPLITTPGDFIAPGKAVVEKLFAACGRAGVGLVKLGYWQVDADGYWPTVGRVRRDLEGFGKLAAKHGVKVLVHNHSGAHLGLNSSAAMDLVGGLDARSVGVFADPGHLAICGEPLPMALDIVKGYLAAIAVKDLVRDKAAAGGRVSVVPLGTGFVDWAALAKWLNANEFTGPISMHSEYEGMPIEPLTEQTRKDIEFFRSLFP